MVLQLVKNNRPLFALVTIISVLSGAGTGAGFDLMSTKSDQNAAAIEDLVEVTKTQQAMLTATHQDVRSLQSRVAEIVAREYDRDDHNQYSKETDAKFLQVRGEINQLWQTVTDRIGMLQVSVARIETAVLGESRALNTPIERR